LNILKFSIDTKLGGALETKVIKFIRRILPGSGLNFVINQAEALLGKCHF